MIAVADLIRFEAAHPETGRRKERAIRDELALTPARYFQLLGRAIDTRAALEVDPMLVHRLQRMRERSLRR